MANITTQTIRVDLSTGKVIPTAYTHQNDTARTLVFDMYNGGMPYTMTGNTVKFAYKSPIVNGQYSVIAGASMASGTVSENKVSVTLPSAYTQISGVGMLTMIITPSSGTIRPVNIRLVVQKSADGDDTVVGASDFPTTLQQIADEWYDDNIADWLNENIESVYDAEAFGTAIDSWLDDHPEATTTVQDGSLTLVKFKNNEIPFVTPEQFGAKGDGITDDTAAWQDAVNSGFNVIATHKAYKCGQITVENNIEIDCNGAEFTCTAEKLFYAAGAETGTVENPTDYVAYTDYVIGESYTGLAMLTSQDNIITTRTYYYGGFVASFVNGVCSEKKPASFTGVTVTKFNPITCTIRNVGSVTHPNNPDYNYTVYCEYGKSCVFENFTQNGEKYNVITLSKCVFCDINNIGGSVFYSGSVAQFYPIEILDSSYNRTHHCDITSDWWHCWTTGGNYLCFNNLVEYCNFYTIRGGVSLADHDNAIGTTVKSCELNSCVLFNGGKIYDSKILVGNQSKTSTTAMCVVYLYPTNLDGVSNFDSDNVEFIVNDDKYSNLTGFILGATSQTSDNDFLVGDVNIKSARVNTRVANFRTLYCSIAASVANTFTFNGVVTLDDVTGRILIVDSTVLQYGEDSKLIVKNCKRKDTQGFLLGSTATQVFNFPVVEVLDSELTISGVFKHLYLSNVKKISESASTIGAISGDLLTGNNFDRVGGSYFLQFDSVQASNVRRDASHLWTYVVVDQSVGNYYGCVEASGVVAHELTAAS